MKQKIDWLHDSAPKGKKGQAKEKREDIRKAEKVEMGKTRWGELKFHRQLGKSGELTQLTNEKSSNTIGRSS